ncbi:MAG: DUF4153 domain-containing protein [Sulfurimonas sp.]
MIEYQFDEEKDYAIYYAKELHRPVVLSILNRGYVETEEEAIALSAFFWEMVDKSIENEKNDVKLKWEESAEFWNEKLLQTFSGHLEAVGFLDVSIYKRVNEYGITLLRYSLIMLSIWFTYIIAYQLIKKEFNIKNTLIFSFLLLIVASITPYNAYDVSITSQIDRLKEIFQKNNMIKDGKAIATKENLSIKDRAQITAIVRYAIYKYDRDNQLEKLLGKKFNDTRKLLSYLNVESASKYSVNHGETINISRNNKAQTFNIKDYSYASKIDTSIYKNSPWETYHYGNKQFKTKLLKDLSLLINIENETIKLDFKKLVKKLIDKKTTIISYDNYNDAILIKETNKLKIKFIVTHMMLLRKEKHIEFYNLDGMFLFKIK